MSVTYAQLDNALLKLGFDRQVYEDKHYVYFNEAHDTLLTFPILKPELEVRPAHLLTARKMVTERGGADEDCWNALLHSPVDAETVDSNASEGVEQVDQKRRDENEQLRKLFGSVSDTDLYLREQIRQEKELQLVGSR